MMTLVFLAENAFAYGGYGRHGFRFFCSNSLIITLGVIALLGLIVTLILGFQKSKNRKVVLQWHKNLAIITIIAASLHIASALMFH